jgi:hypothetical protein
MKRKTTMFDLFEKPFKTLFDVADDVVSGEAPSKKDVAYLLSTGITVATAAALLGVTEEMITEVLRDTDE